MTYATHEHAWINVLLWTTTEQLQLSTPLFKNASCLHQNVPFVTLPYNWILLSISGNLTIFDLLV